LITAINLGTGRGPPPTGRAIGSPAAGLVPRY